MDMKCLRRKGCAEDRTEVGSGSTLGIVIFFVTHVYTSGKFRKQPNSSPSAIIILIIYGGGAGGKNRHYELLSSA